MTVTTRSLDPLANREPLASREPLAFDDRARRVLELRKQIREGTYRPDHREIAHAILDEWITAGDVVLCDRTLPTVETAADLREAAGPFVVERTNEQRAADGAISA